MKKNCVEVPYKTYWAFTLLLFVIIGSIVSSSYGEERRQNGVFSIFGETNDAVLGKIDTKVYGFIPRVTLPLRKDWKMWLSLFRGHFSK